MPSSETRAHVRIVDRDPIPYAALPDAGDPTFRYRLAERLYFRAHPGGEHAGIEIAQAAMKDPAHPILATAFFRKITVPLVDLWDVYTPELEAFRAAPDIRSLTSLRFRYRDGEPVNPIELAWTMKFGDRGWWVLDGCHRLTAMHNEGVTRVTAFELL